MKHTWLLLALALNVNAYGQGSGPLHTHRGPLREHSPVAATRETASTSQTSILNTSTSLDSFFTAYMATYHVPGVAACIVKKGTVAWQGYYGYANLPQNIPVTDSTIFMLASISKTVTATALMQLYEDGRFRLDDSVNKYLPFPVQTRVTRVFQLHSECSHSYFFDTRQLECHALCGRRPLDAARHVSS